MKLPAVSLAEQLATLTAEVKRNASSAPLRVHLFQLLCVMGNWQRALAQLQVCGQLDAKALAMAQTYREAIRCEVFRAEVFAGRRRPQTMGEPPSWIGQMIEALRHDADGNRAAAAELRASALDSAEPTLCTVDGVECEWFCDGDARLGPVFEVIANGQYYWLPIASCQGLQIEAPVDLRDLVWAPAELMLPNQGRVPVLLPVRYPGTVEALSDTADELKNSRATQWTELAAVQWAGLGQRIWMSDVGEHPVLDTRLITITSGSQATNSAD